MLQEHREQLTSTVNAHKAGRIDLAQKGYLSLRALYPQNFDIVHLLGLTFLQTGQFARSIEIITQAIAINPASAMAHGNLGNAYKAAGNLQLALENYSKALSLNPNFVEACYNRGNTRHALNHVAEALDDYECVLRQQPNHVLALVAKGNVLKHLGRNEAALQALDAAIEFNPAFAEAFSNKGSILTELGRYDEAAQSLDRAVSLKPGFPDAHYNAGNLELKRGNHERAIASYDRAIGLRPNYVEAFSNRGNALKELGRVEEAIASYDAALRLKPDDAEAYNNRANALRGCSRLEEALASYDRAIECKPDFAEAFSNRGNTLKALHRIEEALASYDRAIALQPEYAEAHSNRGNAMKELNRFEEALASYDKAISLKSDYAEAYCNRGNALKDMKRLDDALASYDSAIRIKPDYAEAYGNRGVVLMDIGRSDEALASLGKAIELQPGNAEAYGNRGTALTELNRLEEALGDFGEELRITARGKGAAESVVEHCVKLLSVDKIPAIYLSEEQLTATRRRVEDVLDELMEVCREGPELGKDGAEIARHAVLNLTGFYISYHQENDRETMRKLSSVSSTLLSVPQPDVKVRPQGERRIRLGIASGRLRNHNGANWAYNWLRQLPRGDYEFFTYNFDTTKDDLARRFSELGTHRQLSWSVSNQDNILQRLRDDQLDTLMLPDVGMTSVSRYLSLHRIAPCQFTAWGHPVTTGSPQMDCYLSSDLMEPENAQEHYTERLVRMPNLALYLEEERAAPSLESAQSFGLPEGRVLYGCLQSLYKYLPRYDGIFPEIALAVPSATFVFLEGKPSYMTDVMRVRLERAFAERGLDAGRHVVFLPRQSSDSFDRLVQLMDVCIDSVGWSGGNTSLRNIALGTPLATVEGKFMRGRHTAAMFRMIGAEEMISRSADEYVGMLVKLGKDSEFRQHCRELFIQNQDRLYRDRVFSTALDGFLKEWTGTAVA